MNLTWHLVRKDLRQFRWPIAGWAGLIGTKLFLGMVILSGGLADPRGLEGLGLIAQALAALEYAGLLLVLRIIQTDSPADLSAFWLTRPVSGARLLRAKLLALGVIFLPLPILLTLPWWLWCGYGIAQISWAAFDTAVPHLAVLLVGLAVGLLTKSLFQGLAALIGGVVALAILSGFIEYDALRRPEMATRAVYGLVIAGASFTLTTWWQFTARRTRQSLVLVGATICILSAVSRWGPRSGQAQDAWSRLREARSAILSERPPPSLRFMLIEASLGPWMEGHQRVQIVIDVEGVAGEEGLEPFRAEFSWRWPDGTSSHVHGRAATGFSSLTDWESFRQVPGGPTKDRIVAWVAVPTAVAERIFATQAECRLRLGLELVRFDAAEIPRYSRSAVSTNGCSSHLVWMDRRTGVGGRLAGRMSDLGRGLAPETLPPVDMPPVFVEMTSGPELLIRELLTGGWELRRFPYSVRTGHPSEHSGLSILDRSDTRIGTVLVGWQSHGYVPGFAQLHPPEPRPDPTSSGPGPRADPRNVRLSWIARAEFDHLQTVTIFRRGTIQGNPR